MAIIKSFKINNTIALKLEDGEINIYLRGELFKQCKAILLDRKFSTLKDLEHLQSIDELAENLEHLSADEKHESQWIPLEIQFWAHCSNIQTWVENDYDTKLLHSNLAFPLLKKLADLGDNRAKQRFNEEVIKRFNEGSNKTKEYLIFEDYLKYIDDENKFLSLLNEEEALLVNQLIKKYQIEFKVESFIPEAPRINNNYITIDAKKLTRMGLRINKKRPEIPKEISFLKNLTSLTIYLKDIDLNVSNYEFPNINNLSIIIINSNKDLLIKINGIERFPNLLSLEIVSDQIFQQEYLFDSEKKKKIIGPKVEISNEIGLLTKLNSLSFRYLTLKNFPEAIINLKLIKFLVLKRCFINWLPKNLLESENLEAVSFEGTKLKSLPSSLLKNRSIKFFCCDPYLIAPPIKEWIKKRELEPLGENAYRRPLYFQPAM